MGRVVFSAAARLDRVAITEHSIGNFGLEQTRRLRQRIETVIAMLADSPRLGRLYPQLDPPGRQLRYFVIKRTFVVYEPAEHGIRVVRLLHGMRSVAEELASDPGIDD